RFDQIIVCTQLKSFHTVAHTVAGGKKENRRSNPIAPEVRDEFPAVLVWQHDVDDEKIKLGCARLLQTGFAIGRNIYGETGFAQPLGQESRCFLFVLDYENPHCGSGMSCGSPASIRAARKARQSPTRRGEM